MTYIKYVYELTSEQILEFLKTQGLEYVSCEQSGFSDSGAIYYTMKDNENSSEFYKISDTYILPYNRSYIEQENWINFLKETFGDQYVFDNLT